MSKDLKVKYRDDYKIIQGFVNEFDPCGFIHAGAPDDEYDFLINHLLSGVYINKSRQELKDIILYKIKNHYGTSDLSIMTEQDRTEFYKDLDTLLVKLDRIKPSH